MKELAVKAWAFNPGLLRQIVFVSGRDEEGNDCEVKGIVSEVLGDEMEIRSVINSEVTYRFSLNEFHPEGLKLVAWDGPPNEYTFNAEEGEGEE